MTREEAFEFIANRIKNTKSVGSIPDNVMMYGIVLPQERTITREMVFSFIAENEDIVKDWIKEANELQGPICLEWVIKEWHDNRDPKVLKIYIPEVYIPVDTVTVTKVGISHIRETL